MHLSKSTFVPDALHLSLVSLVKTQIVPFFCSKFSAFHCMHSFAPAIVINHFQQHKQLYCDLGTPKWANFYFRGLCKMYRPTWPCNTCNTHNSMHGTHRNILFFSLVLQLTISLQHD